MVMAHLDEQPIYAMICLTHRDVISGVYAGTDYRYLDCNPVRLSDWDRGRVGPRPGLSVARSAAVARQRHRPTLVQARPWAREIPITHYYHPTIGSTNSLRELLVSSSSGPVQVVKALVRRLPEPALVALGRLVFPHVG